MSLDLEVNVINTVVYCKISSSAASHFSNNFLLTLKTSKMQTTKLMSAIFRDVSSKLYHIENAKPEEGKLDLRILQIQMSSVVNYAIC